MDELIKLLKRFYSDTKLYWVVPVNDGSNMEILWIKDDNMPWRFRNISKTYKYTMVDDSSVESVLKDNGVCIATFISAVRETLLQEAVYVENLFKMYTRVFGLDTIRRASDRNEEFLSSLTSVISEIFSLSAERTTNDKVKKPKLSVVKNEE